jgi:SP family xylose:H+ symportor-like MFS transporter
VAKNRADEALAVLKRVGGSQHAEEEMTQIRAAIAQETGSIGQLFKPGMRVALAIGVTLAILQQITGINVFLYYAPEIFKKLGSETNAALLEQAIVGAVNLFFTIFACWTVDRLGRKPLMLAGSLGMGISLVAMGLAAYWQQTALWMLIFILGYIACFAMSVGPITWVILSEIFPTSIRGRAMAIATVGLWIANYLVTQTFKIMDESPALVDRFHHGFPFWIYAFFCAVTVLFVWFFVPETKGKTLEEIERGWGK